MLSKLKMSNAFCNKLLDAFSYYTRRADDLRPYMQGYSPKNKIYYNDRYLICTESHLRYMGIAFEDDIYVNWKQHIIEIDPDCEGETTIRSDLSGGLAKAIVNKQLLKEGMTHEDIEAALEAKQADYDYSKKQYHELAIGDGLCVYSNCRYYDINGAHNEALCEIFAGHADYFRKLYAERHEKPNNKKIANYYCGQLVPDGHAKTYNWIVQRTTAKLLPLISEADGFVVYANTDGFIVKDPAKELATSDELGGVKCEASGDVYTYRGDNYWLLQYYSQKDGRWVKKGNLPNELREMVDLTKGEVISFSRVKNKFGRMDFTDVRRLNINEIERF